MLVKAETAEGCDAGHEQQDDSLADDIAFEGMILPDRNHWTGEIDQSRERGQPDPRQNDAKNSFPQHCFAFLPDGYSLRAIKISTRRLFARPSGVLFVSI